MIGGFGVHHPLVSAYQLPLIEPVQADEPELALDHENIRGADYYN